MKRTAFLLALCSVAMVGVACAQSDSGGDLPPPKHPAEVGPDTGDPDSTLADGDESGETPGDTGFCAAGDIDKRACGKCGHQIRVCGSSGWKEWQACEGELVDAECMLGETRSTACGNCGMQKDTCDTTTCMFSAGSCTGEGMCAAGDIEKTTASCTTPGQIRTRTCSDTCKWSPFSSCMLPTGWLATGAIPATVDGRMGSVGAWTGTEAVFWGGLGTYKSPMAYGRNEGVSYNFSGDTWTALPAAPSVVSSGRYLHTAVYAAGVIMFWGGAENYGTPTHNDGIIYNPSTKTWKVMSSVGAPSARAGHGAVWSTTTSQMIIWGGCSSATYSPYGCSTGFLADGAAYDPATDKWSPITAPPTSLVARGRHTMVWSGTEVIIWGGATSSSVFVRDGWRYDPKTGYWTKFSDPPTEIDGRDDNVGIFSGKELLIFGGYGTYVTAGYGRDNGARYLPGGSWSLFSAPGSELTTPKRYGSASWFGNGKLFVWGGANGSGFSSTCVGGGATYDPSLDKWLAMDSTDQPSARCRPGVAWTGKEAIVYSGSSAATFGTYPNDGKVFRPAP